MPRARAVDHWLLSTAVLLTAAGLVFLYSSSTWVSERDLSSPHQMFVAQAIKALLGLGLMLLASRVDYHVYAGRVGWVLWGATVLLLLFLVVPHPLQTTVRQADRWIRLGSLSVQPSEFARVATVVLVSGLLARVGMVQRSPRWLLAPATAIVVPVGLIFIQPNFGTATVLVLGVLALLVLGGTPWRWLFAGGAAMLGVGAVTSIFYRYPLERIVHWAQGIRDWDKLSFQVQQGLVALGSGGLFGVGLGKSLQKRFYVPDAHSDLILAIIGEEVGFLGLVVLLLLFSCLVWRGFLAARRAPDRFGYFLATGLTVQLALYFLVNVGVVTGMLPVTGLPLPFVSYGGSALMANLIAIGLLLSVSRVSVSQSVSAQRRVIAMGFR